MNDWETDAFSNGELQWSSNWLELGVNVNDWHFAYLQRKELGLNFTSDTASFYYVISNDLPIDETKNYDLRIDAERFSLQGFRLGKREFFYQEFDFDWGLSVFVADDLIDGFISGDQDNLHLDYVYSEDEVLGRRVAKPDGWGASLDLTANWAINDKSTLSIRAEDLLGQIWWKQAPYTRADASADNSSFDENGLLVVKPVATGIEGFKNNYRQGLKPKIKLNAAYQFNLVKAVTSIYSRDQATLYALGGELNMNDGQRIGLKLWSGINAFELSYFLNRFSFSLAIDSLNPGEVNSLWVSVSYQ